MLLDEVRAAIVRHRADLDSLVKIEEEIRRLHDPVLRDRIERERSP